MEGRLLFAPDPFIKQLSSKPEEHSIPLESCLVRKVFHPKKHLFEVVTSSGSKFNFIAGSKGEADDWILKIQERSLPLSANPPPTPTPSSQRLLSFSEDLTRKAFPSPKISHPCSSSLGRKKGSKASKDSQKSSKKGKFLSEGLKRCGSMILGGTFTHSGTFGVPLQFCKPSSRVKHVPNLVVVCTDIIEERGLDHQGLYRVPGNTTQVNSLCHELTMSSKVAVDPEDERWRDVNVVSSLLKLFFRKLPQPLITTEFYRAAIEAIRRPTSEERIKCLDGVLKGLPIHHFETLKYLAGHLRRITRNESVNKMSAHNLSLMFGPTLICSREENETARMVADMPDQCHVVELIINNVDQFFQSEIGDKEATDNKTADKDNASGRQKPEFEVIFESHFEHDEGQGQPGKEAGSKALVRDPRSEATNRMQDHEREYISGANDRLVVGSDNRSSCSSFSPASSRGESPFVERQPIVGARADLTAVIGSFQRKESSDSFDACRSSPGGDGSATSQAGRINSVQLRTKSKEKNRGGDLTEQALQHLKRLSLDLRAFKHRMEMEKLEQKQRTVSKERIEREYEKVLNDFRLCESKPTEA